MSARDLLQFALYLALLVAVSVPLGRYMAHVYGGKGTVFDRVLGPLEGGLLRAMGVRADDESTWKDYAVAAISFNALGLLFVYVLQRAQAVLPLDPQRLPGVSPEVAFDTATSFVTNTNWQAYGGETTLGYLVQALGLGVQNFVSAATGMAVLVALVRGFSRKESATIGSFWVDLVRGTVRILLPLSFGFAIVLVACGVVQTFEPYAKVRFLDGAVDAEGHRVVEGLVALGPAASQVAIKNLGTNGGGFFNANSAHPFENPSGLSNFLIMLSILVIPAALCHTFGELVADRRQGWAVLAAMLVLFVPLFALCVSQETSPNPALEGLGLDGAVSMEGKEVRFGAVSSALYATVTTAASNGSVNAMHDSMSPLGGLVPLWLMQLGEVVFGGVGSGLYGMLVFAIVAVFVAGLMVGRTPEYLGKKIEAYEMKMASLTILVPAATVLVGTAIAVSTEAGRAGVANPGPHGFTEILYAFSSAGNNNGSAFGGLGASSMFYTTALAIAMWLARFWIMVPVLALAGALAKKKIVPASAGTLPTHRPLFVAMLVFVVVVVGALTFIPALALGPVVEHLAQHR